MAVDRSRVSRWIRHGEKPRPPVPGLLAELLTEHLGRPYSPQLLGIGPARGVLVFLDPKEYQGLAVKAAAANMLLEHYVHELIRNSISRCPPA
ncbi:hypothetical protein ACFU96_21105 [Streptomyces sp. NPDC057620]|uniref:hypothetical protein n=1 Tax=Streptomyces sp. NPDC057620 TaxID=3346185 RepID=UPI0036914901